MGFAFLFNHLYNSIIIHNIVPAYSTLRFQFIYWKRANWPKNQKRCWYKIGSPPPAGSKKLVLKFRSVNNIVIAPANTGNDKINKKAVIKVAHTNNGNLCKVIPGALILKIVVIKLVAPNKDEIPAKCKLKIAKSTEPPEWNSILAKGG